MRCPQSARVDGAVGARVSRKQVISYDSARGGVSVVTEKGAATTSYLLVRQAAAADSGRYSCSPSNAEVASVRVHVLNGQYLSLSLCHSASLTANWHRDRYRRASGCHADRQRGPVGQLARDAGSTSTGDATCATVADSAQLTAGRPVARRPHTVHTYIDITRLN